MELKKNSYILPDFISMSESESSSAFAAGMRAAGFSPSRSSWLKPCVKTTMQSLMYWSSNVSPIPGDLQHIYCRLLITKNIKYNTSSLYINPLKIQQFFPNHLIQRVTFIFLSILMHGGVLFFFVCFLEPVAFNDLILGYKIRIRFCCYHTTFIFFHPPPNIYILCKGKSFFLIPI